MKKFNTLLMLCLALATTQGCASSAAGSDYESITLHVDNMTSRVVTVDRRISSSLGRRVGLVNGQSKRTFSIPYNPSFALASDLLTSPGYRVERCRGQGLNACVTTASLHLPPGAEVHLVIDQRGGNAMYYQVPPS